MKDEMEEMFSDGILKRKYRGSELASPPFVVHKKGSRIRIVSDFSKVMLVIKRKSYPMPRVHEIMQKRSGYKHFTKMDLNMQFYCFELDEVSKKYTIIITPDGQLYEYNRLPM